MSPTIKERLAAIEQVAANANVRVDDFHKRIDDVNKFNEKNFQEIAEEIAIDRKIKHNHSKEITRHEALLSGHESLFKSIKDGIKEGFTELSIPLKELAAKESLNDKRITRIEIMALAVIVIGGGTLGAAVWAFNIVAKKMGWL